MKVNICGIPHTVIECEDKFNTDCHFGQKTLHDELEKEVDNADRSEEE